jgi:hypothetical protein
MDRHKPILNATFESGIYVLLLLCAIGFRFGMLGAVGLSDLEATHALQALQLSKGAGTIIGGQPGYVGLTTGLFTIFNGNEFWARFWPAVFGSALVLVPILFRKYLGRVAALVLAALIVIDPAMISLSRTAASSMMGITCIFAGLGFLVNRRPILASLCWGAFLSSGTEIWVGLFALMISLFAFKSAFNQDEEKTQVNWKKLVFPGMVTVIIITSQFMVHPNGISGIGTSLAVYMQSWQVAETIDLGHFLVESILLQLPLILFGIGAAIAGLLRKDKLTGFLATWWVLAFISVLINPSRNTLLLGWAAIPLLCLTAISITRFFSIVRFDSKWIGFGQIVFGFFMIATAFFYLMKLTNSPEVDPILFRNKIVAVFLPLILLVAITVLFTWGWNSPSAKNGLLTMFSVLGVLMLFSNGWKATGWSSPIHMELWKTDRAVIGDQILLKELSDLGRWTSGQANGLEIEVSGIKSPSIEWALRNFSQVSHSDQVNQNTTTEVLITAPDIQFGTAASYRGQKITWSQTPDILNMRTWSWIKWLVYRQAPLQSQEVLVWVRNDLFKETTP